MNLKSCHRSGASHGFTLIELIVVLVIAGILMGIVTTLAKPYFVERQRVRTADAVRNVEQALADYVANVNAYPCPAPLDTSRGAVEDGTPSCAGGTGIMETTGRDGRAVLIGAVPYRALGIPVDATIDAQKNRLTYAVTLASTDPSTYVDNVSDPASHSGGIDVVDAGANSLLAQPGTAHVFFFSHGADGKGAYTAAGTMVAAACATGADSGNCDGDASFVAAMQSHGDVDMYYDDVSVYSLLAEGEEDKLWARSPSTAGNIYNLNTGNVGIGTSDPARPLHVAGDTLVEGALVAENFIQTGDGSVACTGENAGAIRMRGSTLEYCAGNWRPLVHDGANVTCSGNRAVKSFDENGNPECGAVSAGTINIPSCPSGVLVGVSNGQPLCVEVSSVGPTTPSPLPPIAGIACARGQLLQGIDTNGNAICKTMAELYTYEIVKATDTTAPGSAAAICPSGTVLSGCTAAFPDGRQDGRSPGARPVRNGCEATAGQEPLDVFAICLKVRE